MRFFKILGRLYPARVLGVALIANAVCLSGALAQGAPANTSADWPLKPVRIIVPFAPGGGTDLVARLTAQKLTEKYGQPFVVENKSGAGGSAGTDLVAKSKPDGYTFVVVSGSHTINPSLYKSLPYDTQRDFMPVTNLVSGPALFVVHPSVPANNVREFMALVRSKPGTFSFASSGNGSPPHMAGEMFNAMAGVDMVHVPYKGNGPAYNDLIGGQVPVMFPNITTALQYVRSGKLRALAVTSRERTRLAPEIPTVSESGLPGFELNSWFGLLAPAGTPQAIVNRVQSDIAKFYQQPELRDKLMAQGVEPLANTPAEFAQQIQSEIAYWAKMFKTIKLKPE
jgi:tripartite-type tricarboxylate transporter receptor subunit TctC